MFTTKRNLFYILFFSLLFITVQSAFSYTADLYDGRVKYGTYHCVKDGATCDFERYEGGSSAIGHACPPFNRSIKFEERNKIMADFLNSKYCKFTPTKIKKFNCRYDVGSATVYMKEGKVISASHSPHINRTNIQDYYEPNKCKESKMEGDNGEPPLKRNFPNNSSSGSNPNIGSNSNPNDKYQPRAATVNNIPEQSLKNEIEPFNAKISSLQNEIEPLKNEIESLKNEINTLKEQNQSLQMYSHYQSAFLAILFVLLLIALTKSNRNPYDRL